MRGPLTLRDGESFLDFDRFDPDNDVQVRCAAEWVDRYSWAAVGAAPEEVREQAAERIEAARNSD